MIRDQDVVDLLGAMVAIPSINPAFQLPADPPEWFGEAKMAEFVAGWLRQEGFEVEIQTVRPGRPNVIARLRGTGDGRALLWEGHMDTVQVAGMTVEPFLPALRDGRLYGRGSVDDKACLTMMMLALRELKAQPPEVDIVFVAAVDEEFQFQGVTHYLENGSPALGGIAGEPTSLGIVSACKGCVRWKIEVQGKSAHTSQPWEGVDAIAIGTELLRHIRAELDPVLAEESHPLVGSPSLICTMIEGGRGPNTVADRCVLTFDRRTLPGETGEDGWRQVKAVVDGFALPEGAAIVMHRPFIDSISMDVPADSAIVRASQAVCRSHGLPDGIIGVPYGSDATKMTMAGIPTIIFGPGSIDQAHTADEFVPVAEVTTAARMLVDIARYFDAPR